MISTSMPRHYVELAIDSGCTYVTVEVSQTPNSEPVRTEEAPEWMIESGKALKEVGIRRILTSR